MARYKNRLKTLALGIIVSHIILACGQTGPLVLPQAATPENAEQDEAHPNATLTDSEKQ